MIICAFENSTSIPSFLVTKIVYIEYGQLQNDSFSFYLSIAVLLEGLTEPGEVLALYRLKSLSLDYKAKLKSPCFFFASHSFFANNLRFMVKLIVKTIVINGKIHKNKRKRFIQALRRFNLLTQKNHGKLQ